MNSIFAHMVFADFGGETIRRTPFSSERICTEGVCGYRIRLPITGTEATSDISTAETYIRHTITTLATMDVSVILPPEGFGNSIEAENPLTVTSGTDIVPFLLPRAIKKALTAIGQELSLSEIAVVGGNSTLTLRVLEQLSHEPGLRFLSAIGCKNALAALRSAAANIYTETGLNIALSERLRQTLSRADVIIHTTPPKTAFTALYRKNAICFDLSGSRGMTAALLTRRADMLAVDGIYASLGKTTFPQDVLSLVLYGKSPAFAQLVREGHTPALAAQVRADISALRVTVSAYAQAGRALSVAALSRRAAGQ